MKRLLFAITLLASPAVAATQPTPGKVDPHVCDIVYNENDVVDVRAQFGNNVTIRFDAAETIKDVSLSDSAHTKNVGGNGSANVLYLKAADAGGMPTQPFTVRTQRQGGQFRDYAFQWTATPLHPVAQAAAGVMTAAAGRVRAEELPQPPPENYCYLIRFAYPADVKAAQVAAWQAARAKERDDAAEIALHQVLANRQHNTHYVAQGDATIGPTEIYDDGNTTTLVFPGNTRIPILLRESR